jgi:uncharacterized protein
MTTPAVSVPPPPSQNQSSRPGPVAPVWHTVVFIGFVLLSAAAQPFLMHRIHSTSHPFRLFNYFYMIGFELTLITYVWALGLRPRGVPLSEIVGGKWTRWTGPLRDFGIALLFWIVVVSVLVPVTLLLGQNPNSRHAMQLISPRTPSEIALWIFVAAAAGFCEEVVFRGYLQRQILAFSGNITVAVLTQALIFGVAHAYQGYRGMIAIAVYGALFGTLAVACRSLRPGMMQHFLQDLTAGIVAARFLR